MTADDFRARVALVLAEDPVCMGRVSPAAVAAIAREMEAAVAGALDGVAPDIDDVIAWLERRRANAETMAARNPVEAERARDRARQLDIQIDELKAGMHRGMAGVMRNLRDGRGTTEAERD